MGSFKFKLVVYFLLLSLLPIAAAFWGFSSVAGQSETRRVDARLQGGLRAALASYQEKVDGAQADGAGARPQQGVPGRPPEPEPPGTRRGPAQRVEPLRLRVRRRPPCRPAAVVRSAAPGGRLLAEGLRGNRDRVRPVRHVARQRGTRRFRPRRRRLARARAQQGNRRVVARGQPAPSRSTPGAHRR